MKGSSRVILTSFFVLALPFVSAQEEPTPAEPAEQPEADEPAAPASEGNESSPEPTAEEPESPPEPVEAHESVETEEATAEVDAATAEPEVRVDVEVLGWELELLVDSIDEHSTEAAGDAVPLLQSTVEGALALFSESDDGEAWDPLESVPLPSLPGTPQLPLLPTLPTLPPLPNLPPLEPADDEPFAGPGDPPATARARLDSTSASTVQFSPLAAMATLVALAGFGAGLGLAAAPGWRAALKKLLRRALPSALFTRIARDAVLDHPRRAQILDYLQLHPGVRVLEARRALALPNGVLLHHLRTLSAARLLTIRRIGRRSYLFAAGAAAHGPGAYLSGTQRRFLEIVRQDPGLNQRDIAHRAGLSERAVSYHVATLTRQGLLKTLREGNANRCYAVVAA